MNRAGILQAGGKGVYEYENRFWRDWSHCILLQVKDSDAVAPFGGQQMPVEMKSEERS